MASILRALSLMGMVCLLVATAHAKINKNKKANASQAASAPPPVVAKALEPGQLRDTGLFCSDDEGRVFSLIQADETACEKAGLKREAFSVYGSQFNEKAGSLDVNIGFGVDTRLTSFGNIEVCLSYKLTEPGRVGESAGCGDQDGRWVSTNYLVSQGWTGPNGGGFDPKVLGFNNRVKVGIYVGGVYTLQVRTIDRSYGGKRTFSVDNINKLNDPIAMVPAPPGEGMVCKYNSEPVIWVATVPNVFDPNNCKACDKEKNGCVAAGIHWRNSGTSQVECWAVFERKGIVRFDGTCR